MSAMEASGADAEGEDVVKLEFGSPCIITQAKRVLSNDGALYLLSVLKRNGQQTDTIQQTFGYLQQVSTTRDTENAKTIHEQLDNKLSDLTLLSKAMDNELAPLHKFEVAALINLVGLSSDIEEVWEWIPSLRRFDDEEIRQAIMMIKEAKQQFTSGF
jgi:hypothetical protein